MPVFLAFLGPMFTRFIPLKVWLVIGAVSLVGLGIWRINYLSKAVKNFKAAVEVQQNIVDGNRQLVEDLTNADDSIMHDAQRRTDESGSAFMRWLYTQEPPKDGKMPPDYVEKMNGVR